MTPNQSISSNPNSSNPNVSSPKKKQSLISNPSNPSNQAHLNTRSLTPHSSAPFQSLNGPVQQASLIQPNSNITLLLPSLQQRQVNPVVPLNNNHVDSSSEADLFLPPPPLPPFLRTPQSSSQVASRFPLIIPQFSINSHNNPDNNNNPPNPTPQPRSSELPTSTSLKRNSQPVRLRVSPDSQAMEIDHETSEESSEDSPSEANNNNNNFQEKIIPLPILSPEDQDLLNLDTLSSSKSPRKLRPLQRNRSPLPPPPESVALVQNNSNSHPTLNLPPPPHKRQRQKSPNRNNPQPFINPNINNSNSRNNNINNNINNNNSSNIILTSVNQQVLPTPIILENLPEITVNSLNQTETLQSMDSVKQEQEIVITLENTDHQNNPIPNPQPPLNFARFAEILVKIPPELQIHYLQQIQKYPNSPLLLNVLNDIPPQLIPAFLELIQQWNDNPAELQQLIQPNEDILRLMHEFASQNQPLEQWEKRTRLHEGITQQDFQVLKHILRLWYTQHLQLQLERSQTQVSLNFATLLHQPLETYRQKIQQLDIAIKQMAQQISIAIPFINQYSQFVLSSLPSDPNNNNSNDNNNNNDNNKNNPPSLT